MFFNIFIIFIDFAESRGQISSPACLQAQQCVFENFVLVSSKFLQLVVVCKGLHCVEQIFLVLL